MINQNNMFYNLLFIIIIPYDIIVYTKSKVEEEVFFYRQPDYNQEEGIYIYCIS